MKIMKYIFLFATLALGLYSCDEQDRFAIAYYDTEPPSPPIYNGKYKPLYGGATIFFEHPADRDLISVDASYTGAQGQEVWFSASYYRDSISIYGLSDTLEHIINLYAVDRAGNRSAIVPVPVVPLEPAVTRTAKSIIVKPGFGSFFLDWTNELRQNLNVYAHFNYTQQGEYKEHTMIYTSNLPDERWFIRDLDDLTAQEPVSLKIQVEDMYGNITDFIDKGEFALLEDEEIPKDKWTMPENNEYVHDSVGGVPMGFLSSYEARAQYIMDGIIDVGQFHYIHTGGKGRTGEAKYGNVPWNIMINLGDEYELSRIVTHQRYSSTTYSIRQEYYRNENVGRYAMYIWNDDEEVGRWDSICEHKILVPSVSDIELKQLGLAGDMAYFYPDDPQFTKPTRWFRYEALSSFGSNYTSTGANCLSEITLYAKKKK
jgi:hypothetical protein